MAKKINIYLTDEYKKVIIKKMQWYKCSMSTIAEKCITAIAHELNDEETNKMIQELLVKKGKLKTSIKPKYPVEVFKKPYIPFMNCLILWATKDLTKMMDKEKANRCYSKIDDILNKTYDPFYNYNESIRNQTRMIKENKDYWKKVIDE